MSELGRRLQSAVLYLVCGERSDDFIRGALRGGVDVVQLRIKGADDGQILTVARRYRRLCTEAGALLIVNDRPDLAVAAGADGVHVGQDDESVHQARQILGPDRLIGVSTHSPAQVDAGAAADYIGVGPIHATPTKPGRAPVGLEMVRYAAAHSTVPFFAIGGIDSDNVAAVRAAGGCRVAVVRAIADAGDPGSAAQALRAALVAEGEPVGTT